MSRSVRIICHFHFSMLHLTRMEYNHALNLKILESDIPHLSPPTPHQHTQPPALLHIFSISSLEQFRSDGQVCRKWEMEDCLRSWRPRMNTKRQDRHKWITHPWDKFQLVSQNAAHHQGTNRYPISAVTVHWHLENGRLTCIHPLWGSILFNTTLSNCPWWVRQHLKWTF